MGTDLDLVQGAVIGLVAVIGALGNGAGDALVHVAHDVYLLF